MRTIFGNLVTVVRTNADGSLVVLRVSDGAQALTTAHWLRAEREADLDVLAEAERRRARHALVSRMFWFVGSMASKHGTLPVAECPCPVCRGQDDPRDESGMPL